MEIQNTLENKAKFFAQYWGVEAVRYNNYTKPMTVDYVDFIDMKDGIFLDLKPLSSITDEDYKVITEIKNSKNLIGSIPKNKMNATYFIQEQVDFLRSKGYALPYMSLSVEELEEYGWIKLKSE